MPLMTPPSAPMEFMTRSLAPCDDGRISTETDSESNVDPAITKITGAKGSFTVTWVKSTNTGGAPIQSYQVFIGTKAGAESKTASATSTSTSVQVKNLKKGTYYVIVKALNSAGLSPSSNEKSVKVS